MNLKVKERKERKQKSEKREDGTLIVWKMEEGTAEQRITSYRGWKKHGNRLTSTSPKRNVELLIQFGLLISRTI